MKKNLSQADTQKPEVGELYITTESKRIIKVTGWGTEFDTVFYRIKTNSGWSSEHAWDWIRYPQRKLTPLEIELV